MLNIKNALGYSSVLILGQCDLLILDEIFGLVDYNIITIEELMDLIAGKKIHGLDTYVEGISR